MSAVTVLILVSLGACFGYLLGAGIRNAAFTSQPWKFLRWDENALGYRYVPEHYNPRSNDRILMAVEVDASDPAEVKIKEE